MQKLHNVLEEYTENATQLYIVCALFQVKFCNINAYALESHGLSKLLGGDQSFQNLLSSDQNLSIVHLISQKTTIKSLSPNLSPLLKLQRHMGYIPGVKH